MSAVQAGSNVGCVCNSAKPVVIHSIIENSSWAKCTSIHNHKLDTFPGKSSRDGECDSSGKSRLRSQKRYRIQKTDSTKQRSDFFLNTEDHQLQTFLYV